MQLVKFRIMGFRSVDDSGWVDTDSVTALIGTNESGKTNLLLPLWKLNPAKDGEIDPVADYPRKRYNEIRNSKSKHDFIRVIFSLDDALVDELVGLTRAPRNHVSEVEVARDFDGNYTVTFPRADPVRAIGVTRALDALDGASTEIHRLEAGNKTVEVQKQAMLAAITNARDAIVGGDHGGMVNEVTLGSARDWLARVDLEKASSRSAMVPHFASAIEALSILIDDATVAHPNTVAEATDLILERLPKFVYYSNYGNLDSEIYLPHVIQNMRRVGLGSRETAKARTLKVLFEFVRLKPQEILELGQDFRPPSNDPQQQPTSEQIKAIAEKKKERSVLLQSAGTELTQRFREWWRQGEYRFRFEADGDHFRIWVSDDRRPEEIELEGRSTGLQWFLSFYLIFLVESADTHENAILLLDEPGLSLHPLAQRDLSEFFEGLSDTNQIIYTTHSPFLVDPDHLDRVKAVYVQGDGTTGVSPDLRVTEGKAQSRSVYPVYAALGLTVSDTLLQGCQIVVVEGQSDQVYLTAMKTLLVAAGRITPRRELLFVPAGGAKGIGSVAAITTGKDEALPFVLLDADGAGVQLANQLRSGLYTGSKERVLSVASFSDVPRAEIEELMPRKVAVAVVSRWIRGPEQDFDELVRDGEPIIPQIEAYAASAGHVLENGWKVELAKQVKARLLRGGVDSVPNETIVRWTELFTLLTA